MFEHFPPMNGEYALRNEIAFSSEDIEDCLTDYTLGKHEAICSFPYNGEDDALGLSLMSIISVFMTLIILKIL